MWVLHPFAPEQGVAFPCLDVRIDAETLFAQVDEGPEQGRL